VIANTPLDWEQAFVIVLGLLSEVEEEQVRWLSPEERGLGLFCCIQDRVRTN
jgi:hypothetical protein